MSEDIVAKKNGDVHCQENADHAGHWTANILQILAALDAENFAIFLVVFHVTKL